SPSMMTEEEKNEFVDLLSIMLRKISFQHKRIVAVLPKHHYNIVSRASEKVGIKIEIHPYGRLSFKTISDVLKSL
ncbi:hypothetical protein DDW13_09060, partial [Acidianus hospitalis]